MRLSERGLRCAVLADGAAAQSPAGPDISIGGPGFCFPVVRWNGKACALHRCEYAGKRCKPPR